MGTYYNDIAVKLIEDKDDALKKFLLTTLDKTNDIFKYKNLPESIPHRFLELYLQLNGNCFITKVDNVLYAFTGGLGGEPDAYYQPTIYTVGNPYLNVSKSFEIGKDGVLCRNDSLMVGLKPTILKYGTLIVENLISFRVAAINTRIQNIIDAADDSAYQSAEEYLKKVEKGELGVIASDDLFSKIHVNPASVHDKCIVELIELNQYLLSQLYSEIGIADNYNMKRERLTEDEVKMMTDKPKLSLENLLKERQIFCDELNEMFGLNVRVEINERWDAYDDSEGLFTDSRSGRHISEDTNI